jgi:tRNA nucleotidyltransferase (CCA-adding enzyme)
MKHINLPSDVELILTTLNGAGYEAYVVGGCVRDSLIGLKPHDWDICTSAKPEEVQKLFEGYKIIPTGIQHGTISVAMGGQLYEITTYRIDGKYSDNRHPDKVEFTASLKEDLKRRDFTINAMAYNPSVGLVDYFGGKRDIRRKIIRCVGNPKDRFTEDALRILRAARFAATYKFKIEKDTLYYMYNLKESLKNIAVERINAEFIKTFEKSYSDHMLYLMQAVVPELTDKMICDAMTGFATTVFTHHESKIALIFHGIGDKTEEVLRRLRFDNHTIKDVLLIISVGENLINGVYPRDIELAARFVTNSCGEYSCVSYYVFDYAIARILPDTNNKYKSDLYHYLWDVRFKTPSHYCCFVSKLNIDGQDLLDLGLQGKQIGEVLDALLTKVMLNKLPNNREVLIAEVKNIIKK